MTTLRITTEIANKYLDAFAEGSAIEGDDSFRATLDAGKEFFLRDDQTPGFVLRLRASSRPAYLFIYRTKACAENPKVVPRKPVLGIPSPSYTAKVARRDAEKMQAAVRQHRDPVAEKRGYVTVGEKTFASAIPAFLAARQKQHAAGLLSLQNLKGERAFLGVPAAERTDREPRYFEALHDMPLSMIDTGDVSILLNQIIEKHGPGAVAKPRRCLSQFFDFCASNSAGLGAGTYMPSDKRNPVTLAKTIPHKARDGAILTGEELGAIYRNVGDGDFGTVVKLLMLTGKRRDEIANLRWSEITLDGDDNSWIILPAERTKSGKRDAVPLSPQAVAILRFHEERKGRRRDQLFGHSEGGYTHFSVPKKRLDAAVRKELPSLQSWTLHHLRHTMRSTLNKTKLFDRVQLHIDRDVLETLLGHTLRGLDGIYNGYQYGDERRGILNAWADYLGRHIDPSSVVVQFRRA